MKRWWLRPAVRIAAALLLPLLVPALITMMIWALPGDPASIICPRELCGDSTDVLAAKWNLDGSAWDFFTAWLASALEGDFGNSWRFQQGVPVIELLRDAIPNTLILISLALIPVSLGVVSAASNLLPSKLDPVLYLIGLVPAVVLALLAAAVVELTVQAGSFSDTARLARLLAGSSPARSPAPGACSPVRTSSAMSGSPSCAASGCSPTPCPTSPPPSPVSSARAPSACSPARWSWRA